MSKIPVFPLIFIICNFKISECYTLVPKYKKSLRKYEKKKIFKIRHEFQLSITSEFIQSIGNYARGCVCFVAYFLYVATFCWQQADNYMLF